MAEPRPLPQRLLLRDLPAGIVAVPAPSGTGRTRRGHLRIQTADLVAEAPPDNPLAGPPDRPDAAWIMANDTRRWPSIRARYADNSFATTCDLIRAGLVTLRCNVIEATRIGTPISWRLAPHLIEYRHHQRESRASQAAHWRIRADTAAGAIDDLDAGLAAAIRAAGESNPRLATLVFAAEDLSAGTTHEGPRAFSQTHFQDTKIRDDVADILRTAGASPDTLAVLGVYRSPYIGLGGPVSVAGLDLRRLCGPIQLRADDPALREASVIGERPTLILVENLQAAERACDTFADVVIAYTAGQPSNASLSVMAQLAEQAGRVFVIPDADLGGCRIAARILGALRRTTDVTVVDIGRYQHTKGKPFGKGSTNGLGTLSGPDSPVQALAVACLDRGYVVEQEQPTREALSAVLSDTR